MPNDISVAHRLRKQGTAQVTPTVTIICLTSRKVCDFVYDSWRLLRNMEAASNSERIFVNEVEDLTVSTARLFYAACQMVCSCNLHSVWTFTGGVYVKDSLSSHPRKVTTVEDLSSTSA